MESRTRTPRIAIALLALAACSPTPESPAKPDGPPFETPGPPFETTPPPPPVVRAAADPCAPFIEEFAKTLAQASGACRVDADCACYPGGIGKASGCGGVTDAKAERALTEIATKYLAAGCQHTLQCAPWACAPKCRKGFCLR